MEPRWAAAAGPGEEFRSFDLPREGGQDSRRGRSAGGNRVVPHDLGAERSVLGALMMSPDRLVEVSEVCKPANFFERRHRLLYETMIELDARGQVVDGVTLTSTLRATQKLGEVGVHVHALPRARVVRQTPPLDEHLDVLVGLGGRGGRRQFLAP